MTTPSGMVDVLGDDPSPADQAREAESLKAAVINAALDAVVISQGDGRIIEFSPAAERVFGRTAADTLGAFMSDLVVVPAPEGAWPVHDGNVLGVLGQRVTLDGRRADGSIFPAEIAIQQVRFENRRLFAAYIRDLTAERRAAAAVEAQREQALRLEQLSTMSALLSGVAHELNNPLAILLAQSTLLQEKAPTPDVARRAERIHKATQRASRIVKGFLAMARQKTWVREELNLNDALEDALEFVAYGLRSAGIAVDRCFDHAVPTIWLDGDLISQVLVTILVDAQQALLDRATGRRITVRSAAGPTDIAIEVEDNRTTGRPELDEAGLDPFALRAVATGSSVSLSWCRSVLAAQGGSISILDAPGGGALFRLLVPRANPDGTNLLAAREPGPSSLSVLVVDDETDVADSLAELIGLFGHDVRVVNAAAEALDLIQAQGFDMVFTDFRMPGLNGMELRAAIAGIDPGLGSRTVLVTGDIMGGGSRLSPEPGSLSLEKPFSAAAVKALLDGVAGR